MKLVEIKINGCAECPSLREKGNDAFCVRAARLIQPAAGGFFGVFILQRAKREYIPDWCPLPDAEKVKTPANDPR